MQQQQSLLKISQGISVISVLARDMTYICQLTSSMYMLGFANGGDKQRQLR